MSQQATSRDTMTSFCRKLIAAIALLSFEADCVSAATVEPTSPGTCTYANVDDVSYYYCKLLRQLRCIRLCYVGKYGFFTTCAWTLLNLCTIVGLGSEKKLLRINGFTFHVYPILTYKTGQMTVRPCGVNIFKTLKLRDRWAEVDETLRVYFMLPGTPVLGSGILNFGPCAARAAPNLAR